MPNECKLGTIILLLLINIFLLSCSNVNKQELNYPINWCAIGIKGINMAGAEFGSHVLPGRNNFNYFFLEESRVSYYRKAGFNTIRYPILWERLQPDLNQPLDSYYLSGIKDALRIAERQGMWLILDLHNYGYYRKEKVGSPEVPVTAFADVWLRLAEALQGYPALLGYGLMNEPHGLGAKPWEQIAQQAVTAIRSVDQHHYILVAGEHWSNANRFAGLHPMPFINDSTYRVVYEAHAYFDKNQSGTYQNGYDASSEQIAIDRIEPFLNWLDQYQQYGFIGEFSVPGNDSRWLSVLVRFMERLEQHGTCIGWAYWAGGRWSSNYSMALEPVSGVEKPQMKILKNYLNSD